MKIFHVSVVSVFTVISLTGLKYFLSSVLAFALMILFSACVYLRGLWGIRDIVKRFELTMPNRQVTCLHFTNMTMFVLLIILTTVTEVLMLRLFSGSTKDDLIIE